MKVVSINYITKGSTGNIMLQVGKTALNSKVLYYTFSSLGSSQKCDISNHYYFDNKFEYLFNQLKGYFWGSESTCAYIATKRLLNKIEEIEPNIIHLHNIHGYYLNYNMLFKYIKKHDIKVIWTLHDCWAFTGRCPHFQLTGCNKWKTGCGDCVYDRKSYPASVLIDRSRKNWQLKKDSFTGVKDLTIITPSKWLAELVKQSFLSEYPVKVINNGIDLNVFKPTESDFRNKYNLEGKYIILGVSNIWNTAKGLDVFVELSKRLDERFQIVLVGTNENVDKQLPDNIISIHRTHNQQELAEIYTTADLFINPTREENYPTVNMEAIACGTPVVTFNTGGSPEIIGENCGSVVECDDINALYNEIMRIYNENPFSKDACLKRAKVFDMQQRFMEYLKLYNIGGKNAQN